MTVCVEEITKLEEILKLFITKEVIMQEKEENRSNHVMASVS